MYGLALLKPCVCVCMYLCMYVLTHVVCMHVCMHECMYECMPARRNVYVCMCVNSMGLTVFKQHLYVYCGAGCMRVHM